MPKYLFYSSVIGLGTEINPFRSAVSDYSLDFVSNDGRIDAENPDSDVYAMTVEAVMDEVTYEKAKLDSRLSEIINVNMPQLDDEISTFITPKELSLITIEMNNRKFNGSFLSGVKTFRDLYRVVLLEFRIRTLLRKQYFTVSIDQQIMFDDLMKIYQILINNGFDVFKLSPVSTPRQLVIKMYQQKYQSTRIARLFSTHLDRQRE